MHRPTGLIASLITMLTLHTATAIAQDLSPTLPPSGTETPATKPAAPAQPEAAPGAPPRRGEPRRRNVDAANIPVPDDIQLVREVVYATAPDANNQPVELKMDCAFLKQSDGKPMPVIMYIHGGGWSGGNRSAGLPFALGFARGGYFACTIDYRLSGQATFPAQLHDVKAAVRFIRAHADQLAIDPDRIGVMGHSAGGHLSALLGVTGNDRTLDGPAGDQVRSSAVQAVVDISGPTDLVRLAPSGNGGPMIVALIGGTVADKADVARQASPVNHVDARDAPFLIMHGGQDDLVPPEQAEILRDALMAAGVECEFLLFADAGHAVGDLGAFKAMAAFFDKHLGGSAIDAFAEIGQRQPGAAGEGAARRREPVPQTQ